MSHKVFITSSNSPHTHASTHSSSATQVFLVLLTAKLFSTTGSLFSFTFPGTQIFCIFECSTPSLHQNFCSKTSIREIGPDHKLKSSSFFQSSFSSLYHFMPFYFLLAFIASINYCNFYLFICNHLSYQ